jgi:predicted Zn-dependent protease
MAAISHRSNIAWTFRVLESDVVNAFAVPGGYVYFTRGILAHFNNEAQFAGVLGHEIGHVAHRHTVGQQRNQTLGQVGLIAGMILSPRIAQFGENLSQGLGLLMLKNSRDAERESDQLGVEYSTKIGYDAKEMADFFLTLQRKGGERAREIPSFLSTHPDPGERNETVAKLAAEWRQKVNLTNPIVNRNSYLRRIEGLIYGEDPKGGYLENSVFYHPELRFQFTVPTGWGYQNSPQQVQMAEPNGRALMIFMLGRGATLQEAASNFVQQNQLQTVQSGSTTVNGSNALVVVADQAGQNGQTIRTLNYFIQQGNNIYHMLGVSATQDFGGYQNLFQNSMQSFRELTDQAKINKKPERIRIRTVNSATTLANVLRGYNVPQARMEELAILNGMQLNDVVPSGMMIKIVAE